MDAPRGQEVFQRTSRRTSGAAPSRESGAEVTSVPLLDLTRFDAAFAEEAEAVFHRFLHSGRYVLGPEVQAFEAECATWIGAEHALGVSSGTDAILLALMGLGIGPGDEVICPSFTFFATAGTIWRTGARPVFVDIDPLTFNLDPAEVEARLGPKTRAIMPVHLFGRAAAMEPLLRLGEKHGVPVVEDAAQGIGARARVDGQVTQAGAMGRIGCFSFFPTKNLGGFGDAGLVTTGDAELAHRLEILRVHGGEPKYYHSIVGGNFRIDPLQVALLRLKLPRLEASAQRRRENAALYRELLLATGLARAPGDVASAAPLVLPEPSEHHTYNQFTLRVVAGPESRLRSPRRGDSASLPRDRLREHLARANVGSEIYYPVPLHLQECFSSLGYRDGEFPHSERAAREVLSLPIFPELRREEIHYVVERLAGFFS